MHRESMVVPIISESLRSYEKVFCQLSVQQGAGVSRGGQGVRAGEQGSEPRRVRVHFGVVREAVRVHFF